MTRPPKVLKADATYTFSKYFELPFDIEDILADLGCGLTVQILSLPHHAVAPAQLNEVAAQIEDGVRYVGLASEQARREFLIAPLVRTVCRATQHRVRIEYPVVVNQWLRGTFDYFFPADNLLVIEAKRENLDNGFTQLAVELIALDQWTDSDTPLLYGAVTTGKDWQFGIFERQTRRVFQDLKLYRVPEELETLLSILVGIVTAQQLSASTECPVLKLP